ncbi:DUF7828 domain-containing protein [Bacillus sp. FJAT-29937]|uniref:DUF7828 domain-containing protein n=1 Tax=Bacillus sp. FJAT-29937 TaxID=1720553 RepID=UPI0008363099|nr:hypothetical protein [Bacillus sp. FJAT-29937]
MNSARNHQGRIIKAHEYQLEKHGNIYCIDKKCNSPLVYVSATENTSSYFKTTGKGDSIHHEACAFARPLTFEESLNKVQELQTEFIEKNIPPVMIRLNLNRIDPDYEPRSVDREQKPFDPTKVVVKGNSSTTSSISSLKAIVKLIELNQPDLLASVMLTIKGKKIPLTELIITPEEAFDLLWKNQLHDTVPYFVYGTIKQFIKREKVYFISFHTEKKFSLVVFEKYFPHFTFSKGQLENKKILAYGFLKKNDYNGRAVEMAIKSNSYLDFLR